MKLIARILGALIVLVSVLVPATASATTTPAPPISISGNQFVANGAPVQLHGVDETGTEYACAEGWGIFDESVDSAATFANMHAWNINAVRIPLNEDCWLGINGVNPSYSGANYKNAIVKYANDLVANGFWPIINLHFSAPGTKIPDGQSPMADENHSPAFWKSVAAKFVTDTHNSSMIFDLFNEPYPDSNRDSTAAWTCDLNGGTCPGFSYKAAGMQQLVNVVRAAGEDQPLLVGGPQYSGVLDHWLAYEPVDTLATPQLAASIHVYGLPLDSPCRQSSCWSSQIEPVSQSVPVVVGEFGDTDCTNNFSVPFMNAMDGYGVSYMAWAWTAKGGCATEPALLSNFAAGTPSGYGTGVQQHYQSLPAG